MTSNDQLQMRYKYPCPNRHSARKDGSTRHEICNGQLSGRTRQDKQTHAAHQSIYINEITSNILKLHLHKTSQNRCLPPNAQHNLRTSQNQYEPIESGKPPHSPYFGFHSASFMSSTQFRTPWDASWASEVWWNIKLKCQHMATTDMFALNQPQLRQFDDELRSAMGTHLDKSLGLV